MLYVSAVSFTALFGFGVSYLGMPKYGKRDANEGEIISAFELAGATVTKIDVPCDLIVGYAGRSILVEVKTATGTLTKDQKKFIKTWKGDYLIVRTIEEALEIIINLRKQNKRSQSA